MMTGKEVILSKEGYKELEERLNYLKDEKRHEVALKIKAAREFGDLSENAEYDEAKQEQGFIEGEIREIEYKLKHALIFDDETKTKDVVSLGSKVKVYDTDFDEEVEYIIVGSEEVDLDNNKISNESPIGNALLGKKVGEVAKVKLPDGIVDLKVLEVE
ncbi:MULTISPECIES: transcription elongation factor GreA [unclassified Anaerofustis]|uniref:transcription elongation factor GreA n=1 Tax=Anaerofustis TaxID=264995 RepID=UPI00209C1A50|nr:MULTISPECIES: transcription elongation factor GreA [unclassified Anaerofustis]MCO8194732.1 transcription elongation factor GreA [Anaerofustis sp. NSJ-163]